MLKELYDLSDAQTADALKFDIRWKVACGRSLLQMSFDPSTLVYWRKRIAASDRPDRVFDAVAEVIAQTGILRGRRKRCVDSTVFDDAVATQDTVTQLMAAIRKVARVVPGAAEVIGRVCTLDYSAAGQAGHRLGRPAGQAEPGQSTWSTTRWRCWPSWPARMRRSGTTPRRTRWACWRWSPGRTWSPQRTRTGPTGGGGSPGRWPRTG